jgi:glucose/arabinose dehydrogenase
MRRRLPSPAVTLLTAALLAATSCREAGHTSATGLPGIIATPEVTGLGPLTDIAFLPDGRALITEKTGTLWLRGPAPGHALSVAATLSVDTESEKGLLGVVVAPDFETSHRVVLYRSRANADGATDLDRNRVASFVLLEDGTLDLDSEVVLVSGLRGPANHDGGGMAVGPDGLLYVGVGDTGCNSGHAPEPPMAPTNYFGTCLTSGNGKILRVALDGAVPASNPLTEVAEATACASTCGGAPSTLAAPRADIWAWGFRNPWRLAFDPATGLLWVGDVGEVTYEELTVAQAGKHHGWPWREGRHGWPPAQCRTITPDAGDCVDPVYECRHGVAAGGIDGGCEAITGGAFLSGPRWPAALRDRYLFGDSATQHLWTLQLTGDRTGVIAGSRQALAAPGGSPVSIRTGPDGDLWVVLYEGSVLRLSPSDAPGAARAGRAPGAPDRLTPP